MKTKIIFDDRARPVYMHLEPLVDLLLKHGNALARDFKWGESRSGYYCFLAKPIDFDLIENTYELPEFVKLHKETDSIDCALTWASVKGGMK